MIESKIELFLNVKKLMKFCTFIINMGNNSQFRNPMFDDWNPSQSNPDIFINCKTTKHVRRHYISMDQNDQQLVSKRMNETHSYITKVQYYHLLQSSPHDSSQPRQNKYQIFTDAIYPINPQYWTPVDSALLILRGFRRLSTTYGFFQVCEDMVYVNEKFQIKVWINPNPALSKVWSPTYSEEKMLASITSLLMKYDKQTGSKMVGMVNINGAVNVILSDLSDNKSQAHLSNRTVTTDFYLKNQSKPFVQGYKKNIFRSTKETQDEFPRPMKQLESLIEKKQIPLADCKKGKNSSTQTQPGNKGSAKTTSHFNSGQSKYTSEVPSQRYTQPIGYRKIVIENNVSNRNLYNSDMSGLNESNPQSKSVNIDNSFQSQSNTQLNQSQTYNKKISTHLEYKNSKTSSTSFNNQFQNSNGFLTHHLSPVGQNSNKKNVQDRFKTNQTPNFTHYNRRSDLNKQHLEKVGEGRPSDFTSMKYQKNYPQKQTDLNTYRDFTVKNPFQQKFLKKTGSGDIQPMILQNLRNKTQELSQMRGQFINGQWKKGAIQSRFLTKPVQEIKNYGSKQIQYPCNFNKKDSYEKSKGKQEIINKRYHTQKPSSTNDHSQYRDDLVASQSGFREQPRSNPPAWKAEKNVKGTNSMDESPSDTIGNNYEQKKAIKQKLAQKLRQQLGGVLDTVLNQPAYGEKEEVAESECRLTRQKSARDILIRKKVEEKKKNFAELKSQAMKLLIN